MLGKLLKFEFKATFNKFLPFAGFVLIASVIFRLMLLKPDDVDNIIINLIFAILTIVFFVLLIAICIYPIYNAVTRFKKNLLGTEGYLMNTLPVKTRTHIFAKIIAAFVVNIMTFIVVLLSLTIVFWIMIQVCLC